MLPTGPLSSIIAKRVLNHSMTHVFNNSWSTSISQRIL